MAEHILYELTDKEAEQIARMYAPEADAADQMHALAAIWSDWQASDAENNHLPFLLWLSARLTAACQMAYEYAHVFELQRKRTIEATTLWKAAHPESELVNPDLGKLLEWMMERGNQRALEFSAAELKILRDLAEDEGDLCPLDSGCRTCAATVMARMILRLTDPDYIAVIPEEKSNDS